MSRNAFDQIVRDEARDEDLREIGREERAQDHPGAGKRSMNKAIVFLKDLATKLREQDNYCTSYPIYTVQEQVVIAGFDADYTEEIAWFYDGQMIGEESSERVELEAGHDRGEGPPYGHTRTGIAREWRMCEVFMTLDAANAYIGTNGHRHSSELRVYIESGHRNPELRELRRMLAGPIIECIQSLGVVTDELKQLHAHYYDDCNGGCPTAQYIKIAEAALSNLETFQDPYR